VREHIGYVKEEKGCAQEDSFKRGKLNLQEKTKVLARCITKENKDHKGFMEDGEV
jgi:hypothetical protein